jgi:hypothetical protein
MGIEQYAPASGRMLKEDGTVVNIADMLENAPLSRMKVGTVAPNDPSTGMMWYDTTGPKVLKIWNGTGWAVV